MSKRSAKWDKDEDETNRQWPDVAGYPLLPKKIKIGIAIAAILLGAAMIHGILNPSDEPWYDEQIAILDCEGLQEWIIKNKDNHDAGMEYFFKYATLKFLDECSSYSN